jgi:hypothetical protein
MKTFVKHFSVQKIKPLVVYNEPLKDKKLILDESRNKIAIYR